MTDIMLALSPEVHGAPRAVPTAEGHTVRWTPALGSCGTHYVLCARQAVHPSLALTPVRAACPWMVRMSSTHGVYFWLFPLHVGPAIRPDTFCFYKFSLVCDSVEMRSKGRACIYVDTEVPIVPLWCQDKNGFLKKGETCKAQVGSLPQRLLGGRPLSPCLRDMEGCLDHLAEP